MPKLPLPTPADVLAAMERVCPWVHRTPVLTSSHLNRRARATLHLKAENFQRTGSFKFRGATNALLQIPEGDRAKGVLTYSSGNHAQALALAGQLLGIPVTIIMPTDAPEVKAAASAGYGAELIRYDRLVTSREELAAKIARERALPVIPPYDHPHIIAGQGTAAVELFQETGPLDFLFVCTGGGGLLSGCSMAASLLSPGCKVIGVEPETADDATRSFRTGTLHTVHNPATIADGARTPSLGEYTFPLVRQYASDMITVPDRALVREMHFAMERMKIVLEPTGALALAGAVQSSELVAGARVGVILSGGNVDLKELPALFAMLEGD